MRSVERWLTRVGLVLCGLVIVTTVVLIGVRVVVGPRTLNHDSGPCTPPKSGSTCITDRYSGNLVGRPWIIVLGTLSVCSVAIGMTLREHLKALSDA